MFDTFSFGVASTYLNRVPSSVTVYSVRKERKVEDVHPVHTGKRFNHNSGTKANFATHIDVSI